MARTANCSMHHFGISSRGPKMAHRNVTCLDEISLSNSVDGVDPSSEVFTSTLSCNGQR